MLLYVRRDTILSGLDVSSFMGSTGELIPHYPSVPSLYTASRVDSRGWYRLFASSPRASLFNPSPQLFASALLRAAPLASGGQGIDPSRPKAAITKANHSLP